MPRLRRAIDAAVLGLSLVLLAPFASIAPAFADDLTGTITIQGGGLAMTATGGPNFGTVAQSILPLGTTAGPVGVDIDVKDLRGTGGGWNLQITSTEFTTGGGTPHTLPTTATKITLALGLCDSGTICVVPVSTILPPITVPAGPSAPAAVKFFNATALTGMGDMTVTPQFTLTVPSNSYAGTYTSTMTVTIAAGP